MDPRGLAAMDGQAPRLPATTPLLLVIGRRTCSSSVPSMVYQPAARTLTAVRRRRGRPRRTPFAAAKQISDWIIGLPR
jgi:hypothetical protein